MFLRKHILASLTFNQDGAKLVLANSSTTGGHCRSRPAACTVRRCRKASAACKVQTTPKPGCFLHLGNQIHESRYGDVHFMWSLVLRSQRCCFQYCRCPSPAQGPIASSSLPAPHSFLFLIHAQLGGWGTGASLSLQTNFPVYLCFTPAHRDPTDL